MAKKTKKQRVTLAEAIKRIPHDPYYCNDSGQCPYFRIRNLTRTKMLRVAKSRKWFGIPTWYYHSNQLEYCVFLQDWLDIQDGCKDCGINEDDPEGNYRDPDTHEPCVRRRLCNRETADIYKEMFPDEAEFIGKIVEEDHLEYWYKDKKEKEGE